MTVNVEIIKRQSKTTLKALYYLPQDITDALLGRRNALTPPRRLMPVGDGDFKKTGDGFFKYFVELGGLKPNHRVLEVGCGIGRIAVPLTNLLTVGNYEGFDIIPRSIEWCNKMISRRYTNFHFQHAERL